MSDEAEASSADQAAPEPARRRNTWTAKTRDRFLEALAELGQVRAAARVAGVSPQSAYRLRRRSPEFAVAWQEAMDQALDALEETLLDRAINGVEKPVFYGGKSCGSVRQYSDALAMFLLRARRPETYGRVFSPGPVPFLPVLPPVKDPVAVIEARLKKLAGRLPAAEAADAGTGAASSLSSLTLCQTQEQGCQNQGEQSQGFQSQSFQSQGAQNQGFQNQSFQGQGLQNQSFQNQGARVRAFSTGI